MEKSLRQAKESKIWDTLSDSYDEKNLKAYEEAYQKSVDLVLKYVKAADRVLEIGCGTGIISFGIQDHVREVVGTDISAKMIEIAKAKAADQKAENVSFFVQDGYQNQFEDHSFDHVLLFNILYIVKEPDSVLKEAKRLLKPGGLLITATDCLKEPVSFTKGILLFIQRVMKWLGIIPFQHFYSKSDLLALFEENGFLVEESGLLNSAPANVFVVAEEK